MRLIEFSRPTHFLRETNDEGRGKGACSPGDRRRHERCLKIPCLVTISRFGGKQAKSVDSQSSR
jgi:hypothetical protein